MKKTFFAVCFAFCIASLNVHAQIQEGSFPLIVNNFAKETFADSQIYITSIGNDGGWFWCDSLGIPHLNNAADKNAPGHLVKNGQNYANYSVRLTSAKNMRVPPRCGGGRIFISCPEPMYVQFPDPNNPNDPTNDIYYDWYEYTYRYNALNFGGNTTQVDIFGFPMTVQLKQDATGYDQTVGIPMARDKVIEYYNSHVSAAFQSIVGPNRIVAPRSAKNFGTGGTYANYMQPYIDSVWDYFSTNQFKWVRGNQTITGGVVNGVLQYTGGSMNKPKTNDVFACIGAFNGVIGADFSAAFNRGVAKFPADWYTPSKYYVNSQYKNEFAWIWHQLGLQNRAYGFAYDDVNDQSAVKILGNSNPPTSLTITIYPFKTTTATIAPVHKTAGSRPAICYVTDNQVLLQSTVPIDKATLVSLNGKAVCGNLSVSRNVISTQGLAAGTYYVRIRDRQGSESVAKMVKR